MSTRPTDEARDARAFPDTEAMHARQTFHARPRRDDPGAHRVQDPAPRGNGSEEPGEVDHSLDRLDRIVGN